MTHDEDARITEWLGGSFDAAPVTALEEALARTRLTRQRPAWMVNLAGGTIAERPADSLLRFSPVLAVVALIGLLIGALIVSGGLPPKPAPPPLVDVSASPNMSARPTPLAATDRIVFTRCDAFVGDTCAKSFIVGANSDGTDEHKLFPTGLSTQDVVAMSPDGAQIIVRGITPGGDPNWWYLTNLNGSEPRLIDPCAAPCVKDSGFAFSPNGGRLAFHRAFETRPTPNLTDASQTVIAIMDLATNEVVELQSTRQGTGNVAPNGAPHWSPDGQRLVFTRGLNSSPNTAIFVVDANGSNFRELTLRELSARDTQWSPDGSLIAFTAAVEIVTGEAYRHQLNDIYTVRPDGTNLSRLTTDTAGPIASAAGGYGAKLPHWTSDGRIVFIRIPSPGPDASAGFPASELWVMDANGENATRLDPADSAKLMAIGCVVCPAPIDPLSVSEAVAFWVPGS